MSRSRILVGRPSRRTVVILAAAGLIALAGFGLKKYRSHFFPHRFYVVESGAIYRGARQTPEIMRSIIQKYGIRTIVNLDDKVLEKGNPNAPGADVYAEEKAVARDLGVQYFGFIWNGSGLGAFDEYDAVADILATTSTRPVFIHCAAGEKRTNAGIAAYWIRFRGFTLDRTVEELKRYGLRPFRKPSLMKYLTAYYDYTKQNPRPHPSAVLRGGVGHETDGAPDEKP